MYAARQIVRIQANYKRRPAASSIVSTKTNVRLFKRAKISFPSVIRPGDIGTSLCAITSQLSSSRSYK